MVVHLGQLLVKMFFYSLPKPEMKHFFVTFTKNSREKKEVTITVFKLKSLFFDLRR